jgi:hypothetical protein
MYILLTCSDDNHIGLNAVNIMGSLFLPADRPSHMTIQGIDFGELKKRLDRRMHRP